MRSIFFLFGIFIMGMGYSQNILLPQKSSSSTFNSDGKWIIGGNIGANIDSERLDIQIAPRVGYRIIENLELGASVSYTFRNTKSVSMRTLGVGPYLSYVYQGFVFGTSYQHLMSSTKVKITENIAKRSENALFVSVGYRHQIGGKAYAELGMRYNLLYNRQCGKKWCFFN
ncbi:hypothetical protein [Capnocytophaga canis]|uniref:hypothetical protein n=1 Tax=Capnocytophaga canis TaxID=1848903 RepID=UPI00156263AC|nr:hypothetical protein [Capnocytophaga canis]